MFQDSHHFIGGRRNAGNRHHAVPINLQHLVRTIVHHHVACGRTTISGHHHAIAILEGQNRGGIREFLAVPDLAGTSQRVTLLFKQLKEISLHSHNLYLTFIRI